MVSRLRRRKTTNSRMQRMTTTPPTTLLIKTIPELHMDSKLKPAARFLIEEMCHVQMLHSTPYIDLTDVKFNTNEYMSSDKRTFTKHYMEKALVKQAIKIMDVPNQNKATQTDPEDKKTFQETPKNLQEDLLEKTACTSLIRKSQRNRPEKSAVTPKTRKTSSRYRFVETIDLSMDEKNDEEIENETPSCPKNTKLSAIAKKRSRPTKFIISSDEENNTAHNVVDENLLSSAPHVVESEIDTVVDDNAINNNSDKHSDSEEDHVNKDLIVNKSSNEAQKPDEEDNTSVLKNAVIPTQDFMDVLAGNKEKAKKYGIDLDEAPLAVHTSKDPSHAERIETNNQLAENCKKLLSQLVSCYEPEPSDINNAPDVNLIEEGPDKETDDSEIGSLLNKSRKIRKICFSEEEAGIVPSECLSDQEEVKAGVESDSEHDIPAIEAVKGRMDTPEESAKEESEIEDIEGNYNDSTVPQESLKVKARTWCKKRELLSNSKDKRCTPNNVDAKKHNEVAPKKRPSFKIRFSKGFELNKPVCSMCRSVFRKKVDLEVHCLRHLDNRSLFVNVMRRKLPQTYDTSKNDIDKYLKPKKRMSTPFMDVDAAKDLLSKYCLDETYLEPFDSFLENDIGIMNKSSKECLNDSMNRNPNSEEVGECLDDSINSSHDAEKVGEEVEEVQGIKDVVSGEESKPLNEIEESVNHVKVLSDITIVPGDKPEHVAKMSLHDIEMILSGENIQDDQKGNAIETDEPGPKMVGDDTDMPEEANAERNEEKPAQIEEVEAEHSVETEIVNSDDPTEKETESNVLKIEDKGHDSDSSISSRDTVILPQDYEVEIHTEKNIETEITPSQNRNVANNGDNCVGLEEHLNDEINLEVSSPAKSPEPPKKRLRDSDDEIFETPAKKQKESDVISVSYSSIEDYVSCIDETSPAAEKKSEIVGKHAMECNNDSISAESSPSKCSDISEDDNPQLMLKLANLDKQMQEIIEGNKEQRNDSAGLDCTLVDVDKAELNES